MDVTLVVICLLAAIIGFQQWFYMRQVHRLIDKLMSRSYTEYENAKKPKAPKVKLDDAVPEDLRALSEFQSMMSV